MNFFQKISYLQYPMMLIAMYFAIKPYTYIFEVGVNNQDKMFADLNSLLIFMGLGISFSTLQDTSKTQNKFSLKIMPAVFLFCSSICLRTHSETRFVP